MTTNPTITPPPRHAASSAGTATLALLVPCGHCWQPPGVSCLPWGQHMARYLRAYRKGLLPAAELFAIVAALDVITTWQVVPDVTP